MLSVNELMNLQKTNFISGVEVMQWASFQIGKQSNLLTPMIFPNLCCCLKEMVRSLIRALENTVVI